MATDRAARRPVSDCARTATIAGPHGRLTNALAGSGGRGGGGPLTGASTGHRRCRPRGRCSGSCGGVPADPCMCCGTRQRSSSRTWAPARPRRSTRSSRRRPSCTPPRCSARRRAHPPPTPCCRPAGCIDSRWGPAGAPPPIARPPSRCPPRPSGIRRRWRPDLCRDVGRRRCPGSSSPPSPGMCWRSSRRRRIGTPRRRSCCRCRSGLGVRRQRRSRQKAGGGKGW